MNGPGYICFPSTDMISKAYGDPELRTILNRASITFTDGKFTEFYARCKGEKNIANVSGFHFLEILLNTNMTHYIYGLDERSLKILKNKIDREHPDSNVIGYKSPPYLELNEIASNDQIVSDLIEINELSPDIIWVGISSPKQDFLMYYHHHLVNKSIMVGVGAVLLYKAGIIKKGPEWMKKIAIRWLVRIVQEPKRVYQSKTIQHAFYFLFLIIKHDICRFKKHTD